MRCGVSFLPHDRNRGVPLLGPFVSDIRRGAGRSMISRALVGLPRATNEVRRGSCDHGFAWLFHVARASSCVFIFESRKAKRKTTPRRLRKVSRICSTNYALLSCRRGRMKGPRPMKFKRGSSEAGMPVLWSRFVDPCLPPARKRCGVGFCRRKKEHTHPPRGSKTIGLRKMRVYLLRSQKPFLTHLATVEPRACFRTRRQHSLWYRNSTLVPSGGKRMSAGLTSTTLRFTSCNSVSCGLLFKSPKC